MARAAFRIVIADDHALFRDGLKSLLKLQADVKVVGEAESTEELASILEHTPCDLVLLDLGMERNALIDIEALATRVRVIVVTASELPVDALDAMRSGASAVVLKRFAGKTLMDAIRSVANGRGLVASFVATPPRVRTAPSPPGPTHTA